MTLTIHPDLHSLIPPLTPEEVAQLEANLLAEGCRDPLVVWQEEQIILDGHNRRDLCERHGLEYRVHELSLPDMDAAKAWMIANQRGRRNLTPEQLSYFRGEQYNLQKQQGKRTDLTSGHNGQKSQNTAATLAQQHQVSDKTIRRDAAYAEAVETLAAVLGPDVRQALLAGHLQLTKTDVPLLATLVQASPETATAVREAVQGADPAPALRAMLTAVRCGICQRPLSAPSSVSRGIGPICAGHGNRAARSSPGGPQGRGSPAPVLTDRQRACFGPRNEKPVGSVAWCWQTLDLLKIQWQRKEFMDQQFAETLQEIKAAAVWTVVPPEAPYGACAALLRGELGLDFFSRLEEILWGLEVFHTSILPLTAAGTGDPEVDMAHVVRACLAVQTWYAQVEHALRQAFPAFDATFGAPVAPPPPPAPVSRKEAGSLSKAVWLALLHDQPCTNAQLAKVLGEERKRVHQALQSLVKQGKVRKKGLAYRVVDVPKEP